MARFNGTLLEDQTAISPIEITITGENPVNTTVFDQIGIPKDRQKFAIEAFEKASQSPIAQTNPDYPVAFVSRLFQESGFNPDAVGPENTRGRGTAKGIAQILDSTAPEIGVSDQFNPSQSIDGAIKFDLNTVNRLSNNGIEPTTENIVASYNAGPGNVIKAGGVPNFAQTTDYVNRIFNEHAPAFQQAFTSEVETAQAESRVVGGRFGGIRVDDAAPIDEIAQGQANLAGFTGNPSQPTTDQRNVVQGALEQVQQGLLLNFGDEASAGIQAGLEFAQSVLKGEPVDITDSFARNLDTTRQRQAQFQEQNPILSGLAQGVGLAAPAVLTGGSLAAPVAASQAARTAPGIAARIGESAAIGGTFGGLASAGQAEQDRLQAFNRGAVPGAIIGGAIPPVISAGQGAVNLASRVRNLAQPPQQAATQAVERAFTRDNIPINRAATETQQLGKEAVLADAGGQNVRGLVDSLSNLPGPQKQKINTFLQNRQAGRNDRVSKDIENLLADADDFEVVAQDLINIKQIANKPLYDKAYQTDIPINDDLVDILTLNGSYRPAIASSVKAAEKLSRDDISSGVTINAAATLDKLKAHEKGVAGQVISTEEIDLIKRGIDTVIEKNTNNFGKTNTKGRVANNLKRQLLKTADSINNDYAIARATASDLFSLERALQDGTKFLSKDSSLTSKQIAKMTPDQADVFRIGAAKAVKDKILGAADGADAYKRIFGNDLIRGKLKAAFPDSASFNDFSKAMRREQLFFETREAVKGNSKTDERRLASDDLASFTNNLKEKFIRFAINKAFNRIKAPPEEVAQEIAKILVNPKVNFNDVTAQINALQLKTSGGFNKKLGNVLSAVQAEQQLISEPLGIE